MVMLTRYNLNYPITHAPTDFNLWCTNICVGYLWGDTGTVSSLVIRGLVWAGAVRKGARRYHNLLIESILHAPNNLFFDTTPVGRILNRLASGI